jgi:hypothetical protein
MLVLPIVRSFLGASWWGRKGLSSQVAACPFIARFGTSWQVCNVMVTRGLLNRGAAGSVRLLGAESGKAFYGGPPRGSAGKFLLGELSRDPARQV